MKEDNEEDYKVPAVPIDEMPTIVRVIQVKFEDSDYEVFEDSLEHLHTTPAS